MRCGAAPDRRAAMPLKRVLPASAAAGLLLAASLAFAQDIIIGIPRDSSTPRPPAERSAAQRERDRAIEAEVSRLGEHRRQEAERLVDMRLKAEAARKKSVPAAALPQPPPYPAYVPPPALAQTQPPKGYVDLSDSRPISAANPNEARIAFEKLQRCDHGPIQYPVSPACYPDGSGKYNCQARIRCPLRLGPGGAKQE
ncbi:hypothetical protein [Sphingopyxis sp. KK2]|uniref:hypothetical protein n=1 Tax=Sphingopyxis sp. KK2 TaxID=1855727 RepID=UPI00097E6045|nr:hypothetical protein [Sphingopyxis sp. KK2]